MTSAARHFCMRTLVVVFGFLMTAAASPQDSAHLDVQMSLSSHTALVGEPVWVEVRVTNHSREAMRVDMGTACCGAKEVTIQIPQADPSNQEHIRCGSGTGLAMTCGCLSELPFEIGPGASLTRRYVLEGDFRITHAGTYRVLLEKKIPYGPKLPASAVGTPQAYFDLKHSQTVRLSETLKELPANDRKLLRIEQKLAQRVASPMPTPSYPPDVDIDKLRRIIDAWRKAQDQASRLQLSLAQGMMAYPVKGMEPLFGSWLEQNNTSFADWAIVALSHLNTRESRDILARQAASPDKPTDISFQTHRWEALDALAKMGDTSYVSLFERLTGDQNHDVQRMAIFGLGLLGGERELPVLNELARHGATAFDRGDAILAIGETRSLRAVPILIQLFTLPDSDQPSASDYSLFLLTHHELTAVNQLRTPLEAQKAWNDWWSTNEKTARAYGPFECAVPNSTKRTVMSEARCKVIFSDDGAMRRERHRRLAFFERSVLDR